MAMFISRDSNVEEEWNRKQHGVKEIPRWTPVRILCVSYKYACCAPPAAEPRLPNALRSNRASTLCFSPLWPCFHCVAGRLALRKHLMFLFFPFFAFPFFFSHGTACTRQANNMGFVLFYLGDRTVLYSRECGHHCGYGYNHELDARREMTCTAQAKHVQPHTASLWCAVRVRLKVST